MYKVNFVCPVCGHDLLVEISRATESIVVTHAERSGGICLDYGDSLGLEYDDVASSYRCALCDIEIAKDVNGLYGWLEENNMLGYSEEEASNG